MIKEIKLLDSSYFSNMIDYYPLGNKEFAFVWDKLKAKIESKEIILLDKVYKELEKYSQAKKFIKLLEGSIVNTNEKDYQYIVSLYEKNQNEFSGNFETTFGTTRKEINADPYLIAKAMDGNNSIILTDEIPTSKANNGKKKLNIPNFADSCDIKCFQLKDSINKIIN